MLPNIPTKGNARTRKAESSRGKRQAIEACVSPRLPFKEASREANGRNFLGLSRDLVHDPQHVIGAVENIKVDAGRAFLDEFSGLLNTSTYADFL